MSNIKNKQKVSAGKIVCWILTFVASVCYCYFGYHYVSADLDIFNSDGTWAVKATVTEIGEYVSDDFTAGTVDYEGGTLYFKAKINNTSTWKGIEVKAAQTFDTVSGTNYERKVEVGDKVILYNYGTPQGDADWVLGSHERLTGVLLLGAAFILLLILFGGMKGINTIVSLGFTVLAVFMVFVPSVLAGFDIYMMTGITCIFVILMTLLIVGGPTSKSFTTILGCSFGVVVAAGLSILFDKILELTGMLDEHSIYLQYLDSGVEINLRALIFGMIVIGAMGAVMDVAMDISSSLYEIHTKVDRISFGELFRSGLNIGRDVMGTMANTLVLAYIGSSLCSILLFITYCSSLFELLNKETIVVELLQSLIGSTAVLLTMPLTTLVCCIMYTDKDGRRFGERKYIKAAKKVKELKESGEVEALEAADSANEAASEPSKQTVSRNTFVQTGKFNNTFKNTKGAQNLSYTMGPGMVDQSQFDPDAVIDLKRREDELNKLSTRYSDRK